MRFKLPVALFAGAVAMFSSVGFNPASSTVMAADTNAYFDALITRPGFWKGYSFRPKPGYGVDSPYFSNQLEYKKNGGYQQSNSAPRFVVYDSDMDAAKVSIPAWVQPNWSMVTSVPMSPSDTKIYPSFWSSGTFSNKGAQIKIDGEIMVHTGVDPDGTVPRGVLVARGQYGTKATAHVAGSAINMANNSLPQQVRVPLETADGNTYVFTWDVMYTSSFMGTGLAGNKTFQFSSGEDAIWWEVKTRMDGGKANLSKPANFNKAIHVGGLDVRSHNRLGGNANWLLTDGSSLGPSATGTEPISPMQSTFILYPNRWTRYWLVVEQRANDYDYVDMWVADEVQNPTLIYKRIPASTFSKGTPSIKKFWLEFNDSAARLPEERALNPRDMVAYVRNFAAMMNLTDVAPLLQRPVPGVLPGDTSSGPGAPKNVRVFRN
jgi:hypothetical protein